MVSRFFTTFNSILQNMILLFKTFNYIKNYTSILNSQYVNVVKTEITQRL